MNKPDNAATIAAAACEDELHARLRQASGIADRALGESASLRAVLDACIQAFHAHGIDSSRATLAADVARALGEPAPAPRDGFPITGVWLRTVGCQVQVLIQHAGAWRMAICEHADIRASTISHIVEPSGLARLCPHTDSGPERPRGDVVSRGRRLGGFSGDWNAALEQNELAAPLPPPPAPAARPAAPPPTDAELAELEAIEVSHEPPELAELRDQCAKLRHELEAARATRPSVGAVAGDLLEACRNLTRLRDLDGAARAAAAYRALIGG